MQSLRWSSREHVVIKDRHCVQERDVFTHRFACAQKHPELCITKDAPIYDACMQVASLLESYFAAQHLRSFFRLRPPGAVDGAPGTFFGTDVVVYFSHKRSRRFHAQVTHVFVQCQYLTDGEFAFRQRDHFLFEYLNQWTLAKLLLSNFGELAHGETYEVQPLRCEDRLGLRSLF